MLNSRNHDKTQAGLSLIELMIAIAIGGILLVGLTSVFFNSSRAQRELEKSGALIENGRYAISLLTDDFRHAGFYGQFSSLDDPPAALPDPCDLDIADLQTAMPQGIQGYASDYTDPDDPIRPDISATTCDDAGFFTDDNLLPGSDILVVMRADTGVWDIATATATGDVYLQANSLAVNLFEGDNAIPPTALKKYPTTTIAANAAIPADTRKYHVHVYFVAPCSIGSGADGVCQAGDDALPTLKRLELTTDGASPVMQITPLVEGIERFLVDYGIDDSPAAVNAITKEPGDGVPETYTAAPTAAQWQHVISVRAHLISRSLQPTPDHTDTKTYTLADIDIGPFNDQYKRHVYSAEIRPINIAGRREIPK